MNEKGIAVVSGGSRGLGQAIVRSLLDNNYIVATFSRKETDFIKQLRESDSQQNNFYWEPIDITDYNSLKEFVNHIYKKYGKINYLINNAGVNLDQLLPITSEDQIHNVLTLNLEAAIMLTRFVTRIMLKQRQGSIINISSILGSRGFKGTTIYSASKAALDGFSRSLARELGSRGIRVNSISPGFMATEMTQVMSEEQKAQIVRRTPLGRLGQVTDIVGLVRFLLSEDACFITGQTIVVDGGLTC